RDKKWQRRLVQHRHNRIRLGQIRPTLGCEDNMNVRYVNQTKDLRFAITTHASTCVVAIDRAS
ncbi:MAG: hypothetical protein K8T91_21975, partial [Planctomycetes bacterium]|nr:hypothetical protein [Planctomycetota bacterium]